ncbi:phosphonate C-P lyase system protein PhnL [Pectobacterium aroidearum]|uniref:phosphonate C-P lyase system protein PhnL n=1 Tax=Pectobacterium aroidearum TaxID=1201031 RepID=UPI0021157A65|nr:phosphonate C-P lyase system protein PhnL [Pectobacterium aroidearum]UUE58208.1 phosphonate C-P lyase system protein PhnL [Pectobacterium aroidearum]UUE70913.1 phosphonate C-P lyase system protein PhnL [Pectobacterium aroidearum]UUE75289.1 phosphonate C-P lyase system protein PhnL [Pectobacterium aroidearum]UUE79620.1 phosphonate C-P lyase system protein PhnL [Pectobacterium aroidearum]
MDTQLRIENVDKTFVLYNQQGARLPVFHDVSLSVKGGECVALHGHSGSGKSTLLRSLYGNYQPDGGHIWVRHRERWVDIVNADARHVLEIRRETVGWVSQFLRVIPRISTLNVVIQPLLERGMSRQKSEILAGELLTHLNVPERLWSLAPATFSGGEQQRINIARGFIGDYPILLLDEPTASLDAKNRLAVTQLINNAKDKGCAIVGIFHDDEVRQEVADRLYTMSLHTMPVISNAQETANDH